MEFLKIALFIWAGKTEELAPNIVAFSALLEMHTQSKSVVVDGLKISNYFGCCNFKPCRDAKQIAPATKNKSLFYCDDVILLHIQNTINNLG